MSVKLNINLIFVRVCIICVPDIGKDFLIISLQSPFWDLRDTMMKSKYFMEFVLKPNR